MKQWNITQESGDGMLIDQNLDYTPAAVEMILHHVPNFTASWSVDDVSISTMIDTTTQFKNRLKLLSLAVAPARRMRLALH